MTEVSAQQETDVKSPAVKRGRVVFAVIVASILLFFAAYTLVATLVPGIFDKVLYTPEELEILNYKR